MRVGTRVLSPDDIDRWLVEIVQVSIYRGMDDNLVVMRKCIERCRAMGLHFVVHPVGFSSFSHDDCEILEEIADDADFGMILHDERAPDGKRLSGEYAERFRELLGKLSVKSPVSLENSVDSQDILWFWNEFADSLTLDIGHLESAGIDSASFVSALGRKELARIEYVHLHRNNGWHGGITDHWALTGECRELMALRRLLRLNNAVNVILEIDETGEISASLDILRNVKGELGL